jgi:cytochrome c oxidase subunit II
MKTGTVIIASILILAIIVGGVYFFSKPSSAASVSGTGNVVSDLPAQNERVITIDAQRFNFNPNTITLKKGEKVKIIVNNIDTTHGIAIPDFNVQGLQSVEFTPDKVGTFTFHCPTMCGSGHREMTGTITVTE